jgi:hypothetical protein
LFYTAAVLIFVVGIAHSYLGERYILIRLFRRDNLPELFGGTQFTKNTLRFAWHLTTVAWFGFGLILLYLATGEITKQIVGNIIAATFFVHFFVALIASKGKHLSWVIFLAITLVSVIAANK